MELVLGERSGFVGFGDGDGEESVGDGLGVGVGKVFGREVLDEGGLKGLVEFSEFACFALVIHKRKDGVADVAGQFGQLLGELLGGADYVAGFMSEGFGPLLAPVVYVGGVVGPLEVGGEGFFYVVGFEFGVVSVPAEDVEGWGFVGVWVLVEVGE